MRRRAAVLLGTVLLVAGCPAPPAPPERNVLLVLVDDLTTEAVGAYGHPEVRTPALDRLAREGVRFRRAYSQAPACNPSRASLLTGLRPDTTGVYDNVVRFSETVPRGTPTLPELMKQRGYTTVKLGKIFHQEWEALEAMDAFDRLEFSRVPDSYRGITTGLPEEIRRAIDALPEPRFRFSPDPVIEARLLELERRKDEIWARTTEGTEEWEAAMTPLSETRANVYGDSGLQELQEYEAQRALMAAHIVEELAEEDHGWFMAVGFRQTHTPLLCPKSFLDLYDPADVPLPPAPREQDVDIPLIAVRWYDNWDIFNRRWWGTMTPAIARDARRAYYACASFVDTQIGRILDAVDRSGQRDRTLVIVTSDHGFHLGEHGLWSKYSLFEQSTRVPLLVRAPGITQAGTVAEGIVELVDLLPTLAELVDLDAPKNLEGSSFVPLLRDPERDWKRAAFSVLRVGNGEGRMARTRRWRYAEWREAPDPVQRELYDLETDPWEQRNLAGDPAHAATLREHAAILAAGWQAARPGAPTAR